MHGEPIAARGAAAARVTKPGHLQLLPGAGAGQSEPESRQGRARPLVVFVGVGDDRRSRVAAALLQQRAQGRVQGMSMSPATVEPDPVVVRALAMLGIDLHEQRSSPLSRELLERAAAVVLMGYTSNELAERAEDWCIDDPTGKDAKTVRYLLDAIDRRVQRLLDRLAPASGPGDAPA